MDELGDWGGVAAKLEAMPRGAKNRLAQRLRMDASYLHRRLKSGGDMTVAQARTVEAFLAGEDDGPGGPVRAPEPNVRVPVYGYAAEDSPDHIAFNPGEILDWLELPRGLNPPGDVIAVRAYGSHMEPRVFTGEILIIQRNVPPARDRDTLFEFTDGTATIKTFKGERQGQVFAHQYTPDEEVRYDASTVKAMHSVFCRL